MLYVDNAESESIAITYTHERFASYWTNSITKRNTDQTHSIRNNGHKLSVSVQTYSVCVCARSAVLQIMTRNNFVNVLI